ncbi:hypothetical protein [Alteromonas flava]|uniref:hypothetical protein n=1 Tax=Alteromonas flava TaxID=2048003 RepID=UPI000C28336C|nr:hypothetical protein [Alteromonas flava]
MTKREKRAVVGGRQRLFGITRIARVLAKSSRCIADSYRVPEISPYLKSYRVSDLPTIRRFREIHKIHILNKSQNVCFALRLAMTSLLSTPASIGKDASKKPVIMCTIRFNNDFSANLSSRPDPVNYYGRLVKSRLSKLGIKNFFLVLESNGSNDTKSSPEGLHAHIVLNTNGICLKLISRNLKRFKELLKDKNDNVAKSALAITSGYKKKLFFQSSLEASIFENFIAGDLSEWSKDTRSNGARISFVYEEKCVTDLDVGLADYLSKSLHQQIFKGHRNYYICRALIQKMKLNFEKLLQ